MAEHAEVENNFGPALRIGLKEGGFVEGTNYALAVRYANGEGNRLAPLAAELAALNPRVIITAADEPVITVHRVAPTVPLVISNMTGDPVAFGLAGSYARPGGTVTGMTLNAGGGEDALIGKRMGLLKELVPGLTRIGMIGGPDSPTFIDQQNGAKEAASRLGLVVLPLPVRSLDDVEAAFASGVRTGLGAFYVTGNPLMMTNRAKVAEFAARAGKPTIGLVTEQVRAGLLMSYAPDLEDAWRHAGDYAAKNPRGHQAGRPPGSAGQRIHVRYQP